MSDVAAETKREFAAEHAGAGAVNLAAGPGLGASGAPTKEEQVQALLALAELDARLRQGEALAEGQGEKPSAAQRRKRDELDAQRSLAAQGLPHEVLALYDVALRSAREPFVAKLVAGVCSGCRLQLATSLAQRVRKSRYVSACPYCRRLLQETAEPEPVRPARSRK